MRFDPQLAEHRFGYGLSPVIAPVASVQAMLNGVSGPDIMAVHVPIETFEVFQARLVDSRALIKARRKVRGSPEGQRLRKARNLLKKAAREDRAFWLGQTFARRVQTRSAFRERLVAFWADHFTALGKAGVIKRATSPYVESAIRPKVNGRFADLLKAAVTHPLMLQYLDQDSALGPNSPRALKRGKASGLNENLAREVLELHTLGVGGPYTQTDVKQLAELFTGLTFQPNAGLKFRRDFAEPGAEVVLGRSYGPAPSLGPIHQVLEDLAAHPVTARHIARKLAVHFVSDAPDADLVDALTDSFLANDGDLMALYATLLEHPAAWRAQRQNLRPPAEFMSAALRALAVTTARLAALKEKETGALFYRPMRLMGQDWQTPPGPDGLPEEDTEWITPQGLAARMDWAMRVPQMLMPSLPDPRLFVQQALGESAPPEVVFAAAAAESKAEAIGLVLISPQFQRR